MEVVQVIVAIEEDNHASLVRGHHAKAVVAVEALCRAREEHVARLSTSRRLIHRRDAAEVGVERLPAAIEGHREVARVIGDLLQGLPGYASREQLRVIAHVEIAQGAPCLLDQIDHAVHTITEVMPAQHVHAYDDHREHQRRRAHGRRDQLQAHPADGARGLPAQQGRQPPPTHPRAPDGTPAPERRRCAPESPRAAASYAGWRRSPTRHSARCPRAGPTRHDGSARPS